MQTIHLISDLHLDEAEPHLFGLFKFYMQTIAPKSNQLFVLGDLFEAWVGDDHDSPFNQEVIAQFKAYSENQGQLFFAHGNRDFLLGEAFAEACGGQLIQEPHNIEWTGRKIALMHGDSLCTDDTEYQQFRQMVRTPQWQSQFLSQPLAGRLAYAEQARAKSKASQENKASNIMDVNQTAVESFMLENNCDWLLHGHTHREASHQVVLNNGKPATRIVLSDWGQKGHFLALENGEYLSQYFELD